MADEKDPKKDPRKDPKKDPEQTDETAAEPSKSKLPLMKIGIIAGALLIQIVGSYFLQKALFFGPVSDADAAIIEETTEDEHEEGHGDTEHGEHTPDAWIIMLDEMVVNPAGTEGRRFLATKIGLQSTSEEAETQITEKSVFIRDAVINLLSSKTLNELSSIAYRDTLREEIRNAVNHQFKTSIIDNVVFSDYVLQ